MKILALDPVIPDDFVHVPAGDMPKRVHSDNIRNHKEAIQLAAEYQEAWKAWKIRDSQARLEQWEAHIYQQGLRND